MKIAKVFMELKNGQIRKSESSFAYPSEKQNIAKSKKHIFNNLKGSDVESGFGYIENNNK